MEEITIELKLTEEDIYTNRKELLFTKIAPNKLLVLNIIAPIVAVNQIITKPPFGINILHTGLLLLLPIFFYLLLPRLIKKGISDSFKTNKALQSTNTINFGSQGIQICSESISSTIKWNELYKMSETASNLLFYTDKMRFMYIPKRFLNEKQLEVLRTIMALSPAAQTYDKKGFLAKDFGKGSLIFLIVIILLIIAAATVVKR